MSRRRGLGAVFVAGAGVVAVAMAWITGDLLSMEVAENEARADAAHQETLRLALWRMDSWLGPALAAETELLVPAATRLVRATYTVDADGSVRAVRGGDAEAEKAVRALDVGAARKRIQATETLVRDLVCSTAQSVQTSAQSWQTPKAEPPAPASPKQAAATPQGPGANYSSSDRNSAEYKQRKRSSRAAQVANDGLSQNLPPATNEDGTKAADAGASRWDGGRGPLTAVWVASSAAAPDLLLVRRALFMSSSVGNMTDRGDVNVHVVDWAVVRAGLLDQVADVLPLATLRPVDELRGDVDQGFVLASVPVALDAPRPDAEAMPLVTPARVTLAVAWTALLASIGAIAFALRRTIDLSERRNRFASSVTHELRTPLTTFRLYSEMLADGMVEDPARRQEYLETLKSESGRLALLVENVLSYARVEEGRTPVRREQVSVADLLVRATPPLDRRAAEAGATLVVQAGDAGAVVLDTDRDVLGQILFNLVDNACKYAAGSGATADRRIEVTAERRGAAVVVAVRDHGPGIPADRVRAAFTPFERAGRPPGDTVPGIGLGLALSRALARDLGGDLTFESPEGGGARFVLTIPHTGAS
ncbi:MAG: HAMP domain-containing histidine kinase [Planctomycetes bacterium]|nr:HAMP domain-containing histidine kinase [Planctomycetota bacterium]